jgi:hypothetical protein
MSGRGQDLQRRLVMLAQSGVKNQAAEAAENNPRILRFARRKLDRRQIDGIATVFELSGEHFGRMHTLVRIDYSDGGVNGISDRVIAQGTSITVGFQSRDCIAHSGRVITCTRYENGYRVGIAFK